MSVKSSSLKYWVLAVVAIYTFIFLAACPTPASVPPVPANLKVKSTTATTVALTWGSSTEATGYKIYKAEGSGAFSLADGSISATTWTDTGLTPITSYSYKVSAFNESGESDMSAAVTAITGADTQGAADAVAAGIAFLNQNPPDFDQALTKFAYASQVDPSNSLAVLWMTALTLMQTLVNPDMQTLATDYIGITGYPTTINAFFTPTSSGVPAWISYPVTSTGYTFVGTGGDYNWNGISYVPVTPGTGAYTYGTSVSYFPQIGIPGSIRSWEDGNPGVTTPDEYMLGILYNLVTNNPTGFDALVDHVVNNLLAKPIDQAVAALQSVADTAQIDFTWEMFSGSTTFNPNSGWPTDAGNNPVTISIGKAELLTLSAFLQMIESDAYMAKAISLSLPLQQYWTALNPVDNPSLNSPSAILAVLYTLPTPFGSGFLQARPDAVTSLGKAKVAYLAALDSMNTAFTTILARTGSTFALSAGSPIADIKNNWTTAQNVMNFGKIAIGKMQASIQNGTPMIIPTDPAEYQNPTTFFANYSTLGAWPTAADETNIPPKAIAVNLAPAFATPLAALDSILDMNPTTGEPVWYRFSVAFDNVNTYTQLTTATSNYQAVSTMSNATATSESAGTGNAVITAGPATISVYALKLKDLTFGGSLVVSANMFTNIKSTIMANPDISNYIAGVALDNMLVRNATTGAISAYLPVFPAFIAYNSFVAHGTTVAVDPNGTPSSGDEFTYTTTGSFWWALTTMGVNNQPYIIRNY
jgi:hypothetical protein